MNSDDDQPAVSSSNRSGHAKSSSMSPGEHFISSDGYARMEYQPESGTYRGEFDSRVHEVSEVVVQAVAAVADRSPLDLDPLYSTVDSDSLDALFTSNAANPHATDIHMSFVFNEHEVTVHSYGIVEVVPVGEEPTDG